MRAPIALLLVIAPLAAADPIDDAVAKLADKKDAARVAAVGALAASDAKDARVTPALVRALGGKKPPVRAAAADALGARGGPEAVAALRLALGERDAKTLKHVKDALAKLGGASPAPATDAPRVFVEIGPVGNKAGEVFEPLREVVAAALRDALRGVGGLIADWPGGKAPAAADLKARKLRAFSVVGSLVDVKRAPDGSKLSTQCEVSLIVADMASKDVGAWLDGEGEVVVDTALPGVPPEADLQRAACSAAVTSVVQKKLAPHLLDGGKTTSSPARARKR